MPLRARVAILVGVDTLPPVPSLALELNTYVPALKTMWGLASLCDHQHRVEVLESPLRLRECGWNWLCKVLEAPN